ncbi:MAG: type II toxin-antitoxin system VapC family toxin [Beijerinckiaceae bacterium]
MIILDTNVISEIMKPPEQRAGNVLAWLAAQDGQNLYTTTVSFGEISYGFELLPAGKRKNAFQAVAQEVFDIGLRGRILDYDKASASAYARIAAGRIRRGFSVPTKDVMIAAIATARTMAVATRNVKDFADCGVTVINPWEYAGP